MALADLMLFGCTFRRHWSVPVSANESASLESVQTGRGAFSVRPGRHPASFQPFPVERKSQDAVAQAAFDIFEFRVWFPGSAIPQHNGARFMHTFK